MNSNSERCLIHKVINVTMMMKKVFYSRHLHMEVSKLSWEINEAFQFQIAMEMGAHFSIVTAILYNLFATVFLAKVTLGYKIRSFIGVLLWCTVYAYRVIKINSKCANVSNEVKYLKYLMR